jgi:hypothetical protein
MSMMRLPRVAIMSKAECWLVASIERCVKILRPDRGINGKHHPTDDDVTERAWM